MVLVVIIVGMEGVFAVIKVCVVVIAAVVTVLTRSGTVVLSEILVVNICGVVVVTAFGLIVTAVVGVVVAMVVATETVAVGVVFGRTRVLPVLVVVLVVVIIRVVLLTVLFLVGGAVVGVVVFGGAGFVVLGVGGSRVTMGTSVGTEAIEPIDVSVNGKTRHNHRKDIHPYRLPCSHTL